MSSFLQRAKEAFNQAQQPRSVSSTDAKSYENQGGLTPSETIQRLTKDLEMSQKEKSNLEKEVKKLNGLLQKFKDVTTMTSLLEENKTLKDKIEVMAEYQSQNTQLKEHIQQLTQQNQELLDNQKNNHDNSKNDDVDNLIATFKTHAARNPDVGVRLQEALGFTNSSSNTTDKNLQYEEKVNKLVTQHMEEIKLMQERFDTEIATLSGELNTLKNMRPSTSNGEDYKALKEENSSLNSKCDALGEELSHVKTLLLEQSTQTKNQGQDGHDEPATNGQVEGLKASIAKIEKEHSLAVQSLQEKISSMTTESPTKGDDESKIIELQQIIMEKDQFISQLQKQMEDIVLLQSAVEAEFQQKSASIESETSNCIDQLTKQLDVVTNELETHKFLFKEAKDEIMHLKEVSKQSELHSVHLQDSLNKAGAKVKELEKDITALKESRDLLEIDVRSAIEAKEKAIVELTARHETELKKAIEERNKEYTLTLETKEKELRAVLEKKYKSELEQVKNLKQQNEEKEKLVAKLQASLRTAGEDGRKKTEDLTLKLVDTSNSLSHVQDQLKQLTNTHELQTTELSKAKEEISSTATRIANLKAEYDVLKASNERSSKTVQEREDSNKKLKQKYEDTYRQLMESNAEIEAKQAEAQKLQDDMKQLSTKINDQDETIQKLREELEDEVKKAKKAEENQEKAKTELAVAIKKVEDLQVDIKAGERKNALLLRDLQKQLAKEKKEGEMMPSIRGPVDTSDIAVKKLMAENENLQKRLIELQIAKSKATDEVKSLTDRVNKLTADLEAKFKVIQQYVLRENSAAIQPVVSLKKDDKYMSMLSNPKVMHTMDPVMLTEINMKLQSLVTDLTLKNNHLETELNNLKGFLRGKQNQQQQQQKSPSSSLQ